MDCYNQREEETEEASIKFFSKLSPCQKIEDYYDTSSFITHDSDAMEHYQTYLHACDHNLTYSLLDLHLADFQDYISMLKDKKFRTV